MSNFTNRLNHAMTIRNMKAIDLSKKTGLSKPRISQYINGTYDAKQDALFKLSTALDVNVAWLMGHDVPMENNYEETPTNENLTNKTELLKQIQKTYGKNTVDLIELYKNLNTKDKQTIIKLAIAQIGRAHV